MGKSVGEGGVIHGTRHRDNRARFDTEALVGMANFKVVHGVGVEVGKTLEAGGRDDLENKELKRLMRTGNGRKSDLVHVVVGRLAIGERRAVCNVIPHPVIREASGSRT